MYLANLKVYTKFEYPDSNRSWKIGDKKFLLREKEKWTNTETDKQYVADS